jgi:hypothetical protein
MDKQDRDNLDFLLNSDPETLFVWYKTVSQEDIEYAEELLGKYSKELDERQVAVDTELALMGLTEYPDAEQVLRKFTSKKT